MVPLPLTRSWCVTWFALPRHGGLDVVGSFDRFMMVFHALPLLLVILVDVMTSSHLFLFPPSFCQSVCFQIIWYRRQRSKGLLEYLSLYATYRLFDSSVRPGTYSVRHSLGMCLLDATRTLSTKQL